MSLQREPVGEPRLSPTERKLAQDILNERMERFNAVNELWDKIHEMQQGRGGLVQASRSNTDRSSGSIAKPSEVDTGRLVRLHAELALLDQKMTEEGSRLLKKLQELQSSQRCLEERFSKLEPEEQRELVGRGRRADLPGDGVAPAHDDRGGRQAPQDAADKVLKVLRGLEERLSKLELELRSGAAAHLGHERSSLGSRSPLRGEGDSPQDDLRRKLNVLEEMGNQHGKEMKRQAEQVGSLQQAARAMDFLLPLQAIFSSQMTLRAFEMSRQQRTAYLDSLREKEASLRSRMDTKEQEASFHNRKELSC